MKKYTLLIILGIIIISFSINNFGQETSGKYIWRGDQLMDAKQNGGAIQAFNEAKRIAHKQHDWNMMLLLSTRYLELNQQWAAKNAFSLAFRYSYDMAIGDPAKTGLRRNCQSGREGLRDLINFYSQKLNKISRPTNTDNNLRFTVKQARNALNWLNDNHGKGCPPVNDPIKVFPLKLVFFGNDNIGIRYLGIPSNIKYWVGIFKVGSDNSIYNQEIGSRTGGDITFGRLKPGSYEVHIIETETGDSVKHKSIRVLDECYRNDLNGRFCN